MYVKPILDLPGWLRAWANWIANEKTLVTDTAAILVTDTGAEITTTGH